MKHTHEWWLTWSNGSRRVYRCHGMVHRRVRLHWMYIPCGEIGYGVPA